MTKADAKLRKRISQLEDTLATTIAWIAQSAGSPLSASNAQELIDRITDSRKQFER